MRKFKISLAQFGVVSFVFRWTMLVIPVSLVVGSVVAFFLWLLNGALNVRFAFPWLLYFLPAAGLLIYVLYRLAGKNAEAGTNLIIDEIHEPGGGIPARMAPLVLFTTVITHLFGGSAGREGTAVQIGGSIAQLVARKLQLSPQEVQILLMTGVAAGFGAVFGTPVAGALFALEVLILGTIRYTALFPCLAASVLADIVCTRWGAIHTHYHIGSGDPASIPVDGFPIDFLLFGQVLLMGILSGLASRLFSRLSHGIKQWCGQYIRVAWLIPVVGGCAIILLTFAIGSQDYLSLGVYNPDKNAVSILSAFHAGGATNFSWFWKMVFTAITLGTGFKGGEVTPLFFIGATLGNAVGMMTGAPVDLMAGIGFIAVFAGATNTPVASTIMGIELFGGTHVLYFAAACCMAYYFSGRTGIYASQRSSLSKFNSGQ